MRTVFLILLMAGATQTKLSAACMSDFTGGGGGDYVCGESSWGATGNDDQIASWFHNPVQVRLCFTAYDNLKTLAPVDPTGDFHLKAFVPHDPRGNGYQLRVFGSFKAHGGGYVKWQEIESLARHVEGGQLIHVTPDFFETVLLTGPEDGYRFFQSRFRPAIRVQAPEPTGLLIALGAAATLLAFGRLR